MKLVTIIIKRINEPPSDLCLQSWPLLSRSIWIYFTFNTFYFSAPERDRATTRPHSRLMSASIFSYFQAAVSGLLMKSFTANGIQTAERHRDTHTHTEGEISTVWICSVNKDRNSIWGWTQRAEILVFPRNSLRNLLPECTRARACVCVSHILNPVLPITVLVKHSDLEKLLQWNLISCRRFFQFLLAGAESPRRTRRRINPPMEKKHRGWPPLMNQIIRSTQQIRYNSHDGSHFLPRKLSVLHS